MAAQKNTRSLVLSGERETYFVLEWQGSDGVPMSKTLKTRGDLFKVVTALDLIGVTQYTIQRVTTYPVRIELAKEIA